jgi:imidazolonepropionase-like amidohydrolase
MIKPMKNRFASLLIILLVVLPITARTEATPQLQSLVFTHVTVIDMTGAPAKTDMTVMITGDRIYALGKTGKVRVPKGVKVVDGTGKFLIPGLWDMHVHLEISGKEASFPLYIANGITGLRDMGGSMDLINRWRQQITQGSLLAPRIVAAGYILDGSPPEWPLRIVVKNEAEARQAVRSLKSSGVNFIKVHNLLSREAYFAIADEAKRQGLTFAGHVPVAVTATEASNAGQRSIEHLSGLPSTYDDENARTLFALFVKNGTWQCPTLVALRGIAFLNDTDFTNDPRIRYIQPSVQESWAFQINTFFKSRTPEAIAAAKMSVQGNFRQVGAMRSAGVEFMAGTDVGFPYIFPGFSLHDELVLLVQAGLTPMEALQAATRNPAKYLRLLDLLGTVEKGKIANLVLLEANPLENIRNTQKIAAVVLNGKLLSKELLQKMLSDAEALASKR